MSALGDLVLARKKGMFQVSAATSLPLPMAPPHLHTLLINDNIFKFVGATLVKAPMKEVDVEPGATVADLRHAMALRIQWQSNRLRFFIDGHLLGDEESLDGIDMVDMRRG